MRTWHDKNIQSILLLFFVLKPKHSLSYQNLRIVFKKFNANLPTAFYLRWSPLTLKWFSVILLWLVTCILRLSNCSRNFATTDAAFAESALIIGVDKSSWQCWCCLCIKVFSFKSFFEIRGISSPHTNNHVVRWFFQYRHNIKKHIVDSTSRKKSCFYWTIFWE